MRAPYVFLREAIFMSRTNLLSLAAGVGHKENSETEMGSTDGCRRYTIPLRIMLLLRTRMPNESPRYVPR